MNKILAEIFANKTQVKVLMTLAICQDGLSLRLLSRVTDCKLRSVQLVVQALFENEVLEKSFIDNTCVYSLNEKHEWAPLIKEISKQQRQFHLKQRAATYEKRSQSQFEFCCEAQQFLNS